MDLFSTFYIVSSLSVYSTEFSLVEGFKKPVLITDTGSSVILELLDLNCYIRHSWPHNYFKSPASRGMLWTGSNRTSVGGHCPSGWGTSSLLLRPCAVEFPRDQSLAQCYLHCISSHWVKSLRGTASHIIFMLMTVKFISPYWRQLKAPWHPYSPVWVMSRLGWHKIFLVWMKGKLKL